jgi:cbb3-type cytochrome oxidase maturation protein
MLIPLSLVLVAIAVTMFLLMSGDDQFEDLDGPAHQILMDDDRPMQLSEPPAKNV